MSGLVDAVRSKVAQKCLVKKCGAQGCLVSMKDAPQPYVLVNMDCSSLPISQNDKKCDFIFVADNGGWVAALELKKGKPNASEVVDQLRAGAQFADQIIPKDVSAHFLPIAVFGGKLHKSELNKFRQSQVNFRGKKVRVELLRCGRRMAEALR